MELNGNELLEFKKKEGNAMKRLLRIPIRCKTTDLLDSLNIEQTNRYLMRMKLKFVLRLNNIWKKKLYNLFSLYNLFYSSSARFI